MKLTKIAAALVCLNTKSSTTGASTLRGNASGVLHRKLTEDEYGTFVISDIEYDQAQKSKSNNGKGKHKPHQIMNIELDNGLIYSLANVDRSWAEANGKEKTGGLKSGQSKIKVRRGATISGGAIDLHGGAPEEVVVSANNGNEEPVRRGLEASRHRQLQSMSGVKSVLAIRVVASDGSYGFSEDNLRSRVFDDSMNLANQYLACR